MSEKFESSGDFTSGFNFSVVICNGFRRKLVLNGEIVCDASNLNALRGQTMFRMQLRKKSEHSEVSVKFALIFA